MPSPTYTAICDGTLDPTTLTNAELCEQRNCLSNKEWSVLEVMVGGSGGGGGASAEADVTPTFISTTGAASTAAGLFEVSIANTGAATGLVAGVILPIGATITYRGYYDEFSTTMNRIAAIAYDATGTTFLITTIP